MSALISIIIPTYNRGPLLMETLASVFAQTYQNYELIVVDDGSTDDTPQRIAPLLKLKQHRLRLIYQRVANGGAGAARNHGLQLARGDYITFLDSDDLWQPEFLAHMLTPLTAAPEAGFIYCDYGMFNEQGLIQAACLRPEQKRSGMLFEAMLREKFICIGAAIIRRPCLEAVGPFDPTLTPAEDWEIWLRLTHQFPGLYLDEPLFRIRRHTPRDGFEPHAPLAGQISRQPRLMCQQNLRILQQMQRRYPATARRLRPLFRRLLAHNHGRLAYHYRRQGDPMALKHYLLRLFYAG